MPKWWAISWRTVPLDLVPQVALAGAAQLVAALEDHDVVEMILGGDGALGSRDADVEAEQEGIAVLGGGVVPDPHDHLGEVAGELLRDVVQGLAHERLETTFCEAERHREIVGRQPCRAAELASAATGWPRRSRHSPTS